MTLEYPIEAEEEPSVAVVVALARTTEQSPLEMEVLANHIDPDALDALIESGGNDRGSATVVFDYDGWQVTVEPTAVRVEQ